MLNKTIFLLLFVCSLSCSAAQTVMEIVPLSNRPSSELLPLIQPLLEPTDTVVANGFNLIIKATPARIIEIKTLIKKLDSVLTNLSIRVIQSKDKTADMLNAQLTADVIVPINNPAATKGQVTGQFQQNQQHTSNQSEQMLRALEGKTAYIKIGGNHLIRYDTVYPSGYGQSVVTSNNTQFIEATTGFAVLPRLNGEEVILEISPWSDQMNNSGVLETQSVQTVVKTKLGQWVEIGTINEESQTTGKSLFGVEQGRRQQVVHILVQVEKAF